MAAEALCAVYVRTYTSMAALEGGGGGAPPLGKEKGGSLPAQVMIFCPPPLFPHFWRERKGEGKRET